MRLTQQERADRATARGVKAFRKIVLTKNTVSWEKDDDGFIVLKYSDGQIFKCRGLIVEMAGLL